ncbi:tetratricopeptide repeat protein [Streptomyces sp. NPDC059853]|uniref:tetratricopeptide repeat protein n=1 Tax=Streptomyces sp. NPDC059853 TaxID=3346973 RepID=UPI0036497031
MGTTEPPGRTDPELVALARDITAARRLLGAGRPQEAAAILGPLVGRRPEFGYGWSLLAACRLELGDPRSALAASDRAMTDSANAAYAWTVRTAVLLKLGRADEALAAAEELIRLHPEGWRGHELRARALLAGALAGPGEALPAAERAVALAPEEVEAHYTCGRAAYQLGRLDLAERAFGTVLRLDPEHGDAHRALGIVRSRGAGTSGLRLGPMATGYADALAVDPGDGGTRASLNGVLFVLLAKARWFGWFCLLVTLVLLGAAADASGDGWGFRGAALAATVAVWLLWGWRVGSQLPARSRGPLLAVARATRPLRLMAGAAVAPVIGAVVLAAVPLPSAMPLAVIVLAALATAVLSHLSRRAGGLR